MLTKILLFILLIISSITVFLINNLLLLSIIFLILIILGFLLQVKLIIHSSFIIIILLNFILNIIFSNIIDATVVSLRLINMFLIVNIIIKKIGINSISLVIGKIFHSKDLSLIIIISLSFIPIMIKELKDIKVSLYTKNFPLNLKNIISKGHLFVICFFTNLFKRVNDMEKVLLSKGVEE